VDVAYTSGFLRESTALPGFRCAPLTLSSKVKTISVVMVAILLIMLIPCPARALSAETAFFIAFIGAAVIVATVQAIAAKRALRSRPKDAASDLLVCTYPADDVAGCRVDVAVARVAVESQSP